MTSYHRASALHSSPSVTSLLLAAAAAVPAVLTAPVVAVDYTFVNIADKTGPFSDFEPSPSVNDSGIVAFQAHLDAGGQGIFTGSGGPTTTITTTATGPYSSLLAEPDINEAGTVAFAGILDGGGERISTGSGGPLTIIADTPFPPYSDLGEFTTINTTGTVAFRFNNFGTVGLATGGGILYEFTPPGPAPLVNFGDPDVNDSGVLAWSGGITMLGGPIAVVKGSGGGHTIIADTTGPFSMFSAYVSINNSGTCAFRGTLDTGPVGIFIGSGGAITTIADSSGPYGFFPTSAPAINNNGLVAFSAGLDAGGHGIFTGPDPVADKVIKSGDSLFGSTVTFLTFHRGFNDNGDIAFKYDLANGGEGVALAVAKSPPNPADLDGDGDVDGFDLAMLLGQWTGAASYAPCPPHAPADLNGDCKINGFDLALLLGAWG